MTLALVVDILMASPDPLPVPSIDPATAANQLTVIVVAVIGAIASILTASITAFFAYMMVRVKQVTEATHAIVNHDRQVMLETQAETLRAAVIEHPDDVQLKEAWSQADRAARNARAANEQPRAKL